MVKLPFDKPKKRKKKVKRVKKTPLNRLKKIAWKVFSEWIRRRHANAEGYQSCITCGKWDHWKNMQASHFIPGRRNSILFLEENCHASCVQCNIWRHGALEEYYPFMLSKYGQETIDRIKRLKNEIFKPTREYYEDLIEKYKQEPQ